MLDELLSAATVRKRVCRIAKGGDPLITAAAAVGGSK